MKPILTSKSTAILFQHLAAAMRSGIPWQEIFDIYAVSKIFGKDTIVIQSLAQAARNHSKLVEFLAAFPNIFSPALIELVTYAENKGAQNLILLLETLGHDYQLSANQIKMKKTNRYLISIIIFNVIIYSIMNTFIIPQFGEVFRGFGANLPIFTLFVLSISDFLITYWVFIILAIFMIIDFYKHGNNRIRIILEKPLMIWPSFRATQIGLFSLRISQWLRVCKDDRDYLSKAMHYYACQLSFAHFVECALSIEIKLKEEMPLQDVFNYPDRIQKYFPGMLRLAEKFWYQDLIYNQLITQATDDLFSAIECFSNESSILGYLLVGILVGGTAICIYLPIFMMGSAV